jgi:glycosyltransferase involved in cell wall biosynthesis
VRCKHIPQFPSAAGPSDDLTVSVVIPCLNEAESIERCVTSALRVLDEADISGEVIVADNNSEDGSPLIAAEAGAIVVHEPERGYGSAYMAGFSVARGRYIVMADADLTYDFQEIPRFVAELDKGADMVIGDRMKNIHPGAMPWLHRYVGNPLLSGFLNLLFRTGIDDAHCGAASRSPAPARPAHDGDGVRLRDGDPGGEGETRARPVPDRVPPTRR